MTSDSWLIGRRGQALAVAIGCLGLFILWFGAIDPIRGWFDDRQRLLEQRRDLLHRMETVAASLPALRAASARRSATARSPVPPTRLPQPICRNVCRRWQHPPGST